MTQKQYLICKAPNTPAVDSGWNRTEWKNAKALNIDVVGEESSDHHPQTDLKLLYTNTSIFGLFMVKDKYVRAIRSGFQESVCRDSCVEFFFKPKPESGYFNFEFNCSGALLSSYITSNKRTKNGFEEYVMLIDEDLKKVNIFHSLPEKVEPEIKEDTNWFLGFEIPLVILEKYIGKLGELSAQTWEANCYKCGDETSHPHWISWNPINEKNFHCPECFGIMEFE